ncbi:uncharacterized protein LY79DRAFT_336865 [Colletotrichum navitas]|uniref:Uncharacterized protein n=1 Tax=Colletotrichum navitas TaxID=681940 RepID=A0AAD8UZZ1_9PEZI|nr:uncharacterized protein LY79DRAFT_336865 [Colletotrichum navitas]KAK1579710.1 hypothetical protein LY79DRAFT_336865 [Colletotrichum navitas]
MDTETEMIPSSPHPTTSECPDLSGCVLRLDRASPGLPLPLLGLGGAKGVRSRGEARSMVMVGPPVVTQLDNPGCAWLGAGRVHDAGCSNNGVTCSPLVQKHREEGKAMVAFCIFSKISFVLRSFGGGKPQKLGVSLSRGPPSPSPSLYPRSLQSEMHVESRSSSVFKV